MYANNELLFPYAGIAGLRKLRGPTWQSLIERVLGFDEQHEESLAVMLLMIRLNGCMSCETDSYRAMRGCAACATQTLRRYKGSDDDLVAAFEQALNDVRQFARTHAQYGIHMDALPATRASA